VNCPICGETNVQFLFSKGGWGIYRCEYCTSQFVNPIPSDGELVKYYGDYYSAARLKELLDPKYGRLSFPRQWGIIRSLIRKPVAKILDYGCGGGHFLDRVSPNWIRYGIELSDKARVVAEQKGIHTYKMLEDCKHNEWFDVITMFAVIEHLPNPSEIVKELAESLKVGGLFVVMTVDVGSIRAKVSGEKWAMYAPPGHLSFFTAYSLDYLMFSLGFNKVKHLYTDGGTIQMPVKPLNLMLRVGLEVLHRIPALNEFPLFDCYYGYYRKEL
jgi:SAM-dependent methyltransferase